MFEIGRSVGVSPVLVLELETTTVLQIALGREINRQFCPKIGTYVRRLRTHALVPVS